MYTTALVKELNAALLKVWSVSLDVIPTLTSKVFVVTLATLIHLPLNGSVALGYEWVVLSLSRAQVKVMPASAILTISPFANPWLAMVSFIQPVVGSYSASVGVNWSLALTNWWVLVLVGEVPCKALILITPLLYWIPLATALENEWVPVLPDTP